MNKAKNQVLVLLMVYGCSSAAQTSAFLEADGLLVLEIESVTAVPNGWAEEIVFDDYTGASYFRYAANNQFNNPGNDLLSYPIFIQNPGRYQFQWRNLIAEGSSNTDANDSWLRLSASAYYGQKSRNNGDISIVCPKGYDPEVNACPEELDEDGGGVEPEGSGSNGWFKVYRSGPGDWVWSTRTSDNDAHNIFARFDYPGIYLIEVSGRSKDHAIDRMVLYRDDYAGNPLDVGLVESPWVDVDLIYKDGFD